MACEHKKLRCTNGEFFCLECGRKLELEDMVKPEKVELPKKKTTRKGAKTE